MAEGVFQQPASGGRGTDRIELGGTGLEISRLGASLSQIGLNMDESQMDQAGLALDAFLDNGINFLDRAPCCRMSQAAIGKYVSHRRDEFVLATKTGHTPEGHHLLTGRPWSESTIRRSFEKSLKALNT